MRNNRIFPFLFFLGYTCLNVVNGRRATSIAKLENAATIAAAATEEEPTGDEKSDSGKAIDRVTALDFAWSRAVVYPLLDGLYVTLFFDAKADRWELLFNKHTASKREQQADEFWHAFKKVCWL